MRFFMALVGLAVLVGSFMLGLVALAVVAGIGLLAGLVIWLRVAWIRRQLRKQGFGFPGGPEGQGASHQGAESEAIEAEYTVVSKRRDS
jgi:hypothetical protein